MGPFTDTFPKYLSQNAALRQSRAIVTNTEITLRLPFTAMMSRVLHLRQTIGPFEKYLPHRIQ